MDDAQLRRYSRHLLLPAIDLAGQQKLLGAKVLLVGLGGLGSPVSMYLAASGVGRLTLVDHDRVELTNLQRQIVHDTDSIGAEKTESAARRLRALNPEIAVETIARKLEGDDLLAAARASDIVVDGSDNFATRYAVNAACVKAGRPLVSGAVVRFEGQVTVIAPGGPCYRCLYPESDEPEEPCATFGVLAPAAGVIGSVMAVETLKLVMGIGTSLAGRLMLYDALRSEWREVKMKKDPACPICG
jgi:adenylyltransferase/sulfurtransferase